MAFIVVAYDQEYNKYIVFSSDARQAFKKLDEAKAAAEMMPDLKAREEAERRC
jgi:hypothetical protein